LLNYESLYESRAISEWLIDLHSQEQHKIENSIEQSLQEVVAYILANQETILTVIKTVAPSIIAFVSTRINIVRKSSINSTKAIELARELLESRKGLNWHSESYQVEGITYRREQAEQILSREKISYVIHVRKNSDGIKYSILVSGDGKVLECMPDESE
jgi:hypothetical protein